VAIAKPSALEDWRALSEIPFEDFLRRVFEVLGCSHHRENDEGHRDQDST